MSHRTLVGACKGVGRTFREGRSYKRLVVLDAAFP